MGFVKKDIKLRLRSHNLGTCVSDVKVFDTGSKVTLEG